MAWGCKCTSHRGDENWHGINSGYSYHKCKCERCCAAGRERSRKYREEHQEECQERSRKYYDEHPEENRERVRKYRERNPDATREGDARNNDKACRRNEYTATRATRNGLPWSEAEDIQVIESVDEPVLLVALRLGRTEHSVLSRRKRLRKEGLL